MKIVTNKKCVEEIRKQIDLQSNKISNNEISLYYAFEYIYSMICLADQLGILNNKGKDILGRELQKMTDKHKKQTKE